MAVRGYPIAFSLYRIPNPVSSPMQSVLANLNFFDACVENNFRWTAVGDRPANNLCPNTHEVQITDLRSLSAEQRAEMGLTLEKAGFEVLQGWGEDGENAAKAWAEREWDNEEWIKREYYSFVTR